VTVAIVSASACSSAIPATQPSNAPLSATLQKASGALTAAGIRGDCVTSDKAVLDASEGSKGVLACSYTTGSVSKGEWTIKVFAYEDDSYARSGYERSCDAMKRVRRQVRWWTIWEHGQSWYAEVYGARRKPPRSVAQTFADALSSAPWDDCSGPSQAYVACPGTSPNPRACERAVEELSSFRP
jgi:hypothetical protein